MRDRNAFCTQVQSVFYRALFFDIARLFPSDFLHMDAAYHTQRINAEGEAYLYTTLPLMGRAVEQSLILQEPLKVPAGWHLKKKTKLPVFLNHLFKVLFEDSGLPCPPSENAHIAVRLIRQFFMAYSKVELPCKDELKRKAYQGFIDRLTTTWEQPKGCSDVINEARRLIRCVLEAQLPDNLRLRRFQKDPWGRHGPGAVAGKEVGCCKWSFIKGPCIPDALFSINEKLAVPSVTGDNGCARMVDVPKDFRGPRLICIEPKEFQFAQQGLMDILYGLIMHHPLTRNSIDFLDTQESRRLCYDSSYATIDLKDASDHIHMGLARLLFPRWFFHLVTRYRSRTILIEGQRFSNREILLTMGNATCFPVETLVFWAIALGTMITIRDTFPPKIQRNLCLNLRVFGDDIIVPVWAYDAVCEKLDQLGLVVNQSKCCCFSPVRESCGEWVFNGQPIDIIRFRSPSVKDYRSWIQWVDYWKTCSLPAVKTMLAESCKELYANYTTRYNKHLQRLEVRIPTYVKSGDRLELSDERGLYAYFVRNDLTPFSKGARNLVKWRWVDAGAELP